MSVWSLFLNKNTKQVRQSVLAAMIFLGQSPQKFIYIYSGRLNETCRFDGRSEEIVLLKNVRLDQEG